jgi:hypothetical protein
MFVTAGPLGADVPRATVVLVLPSTFASGCFHPPHAARTRVRATNADAAPRSRVFMSRVWEHASSRRSAQGPNEPSRAAFEQSIRLNSEVTPLRRSRSCIRLHASRFTSCRFAWRRLPAASTSVSELLLPTLVQAELRVTDAHPRGHPRGVALVAVAHCDAESRRAGTELAQWTVADPCRVGRCG